MKTHVYFKHSTHREINDNEQLHYMKSMRYSMVSMIWVITWKQ